MDMTNLGTQSQKKFDSGGGSGYCSTKQEVGLKSYNFRLPIRMCFLLCHLVVPVRAISKIFNIRRCGIPVKATRGIIAYKSYK